MKVLTILVLILAVAVSYPTVNTMTLLELSTAIKTKANPVLQPYYEDALNQIMYHLFNGNEDFSRLVIRPPSGAATWTIEELIKELQAITEVHDEITGEYRTAMLGAYRIYKQKYALGETENDIQVVIPAMDVSIWTMAELDQSLKNETTKEELKPYLQKAIEDMKQSGDDVTKKTIGMVTPVGLIPQNTISYNKKKSNRDF